MVTFNVLEADATAVDADVLLIKYARDWYGVAEVVATLLQRHHSARDNDLRPDIDQGVIIESGDAIWAKSVLILGTPPLRDLGYEGLEHFARRAIEVICQQGKRITRLATTVHGAGYGLDAAEALLSMVLGFQDGVHRTRMPLEEITFVERNAGRARLLREALSTESADAQGNWSTANESSHTAASSRRRSVPARPAVTHRKDHVFVAMPFADEFEDVYEYGILAPVRECGYICERVDHVPFTGDIMQRIKERTRTARFVIADMSGARPNVYLEAGFAWGCGKDVILVARKGEQLQFDVAGHRTIFYKNIKHLAEELRKLIGELYGPGA